jgi:hypothetical protein
MAAPPIQNYANHPHRPTLWLVAALSAVFGLAIAVLFLVRSPGVISAGVLLMAVALVCVVLMVRQYAVRLQDRIIRLEMQVRLARLGRLADLDRVDLMQLVALRFASDGELPALLDRTLTERLTPDQIKRAVVSWQADHLRT